MVFSPFAWLWLTLALLTACRSAPPPSAGAYLEPAALVASSSRVPAEALELALSVTAEAEFANFLSGLSRSEVWSDPAKRAATLQRATVDLRDAARAAKSKAPASCAEIMRSDQAFVEQVRTAIGATYEVRAFGAHIVSQNWKCMPRCVITHNEALAYYQGTVSDTETRLRAIEAELRALVHEVAPTGKGVAPPAASAATTAATLASLSADEQVDAFLVRDACTQVAHARQLALWQARTEGGRAKLEALRQEVRDLVKRGRADLAEAYNSIKSAEMPNGTLVIAVRHDPSWPKVTP